MLSVLPPTNCCAAFRDVAHTKRAIWVEVRKPGGWIYQSLVTQNEIHSIKLKPHKNFGSQLAVDTKNTLRLRCATYHVGCKNDKKLAKTFLIKPRVLF